MWDLLQEDGRYFEAFKKSKMYIKLLAELDLLQDATIAKSSSGAADIYQNGLALFFSSCAFTLGLQVGYSAYISLSLSSITWYWPKSRDALWLGN